MASKKWENIDCSVNSGHKDIKRNEIADSETQRYTNKTINPQACIVQSLNNTKQQIYKSNNMV